MSLIKRFKGLLSLTLIAFSLAGFITIHPNAAVYADVGWNEDSTVVIYNNATLANGVDVAVLEWAAFAGTTNYNSYIQQKNANTAVGVTWDVIYWPNGVKTKLSTIRTSQAAAKAYSDPIVVFTNTSATHEQLFIAQGKVPYYGPIKVNLTVRAFETYTPGVTTTDSDGNKTTTPTNPYGYDKDKLLTIRYNDNFWMEDALSSSSFTPTSLEDWFKVTLLERDKYDETIKAATNMLKQTDRYKSDYLKDLQGLRDAFQHLLANTDANTPAATATLDEAHELLILWIKMPESGSNNVLKLTGWTALDDKLGDPFKLFCWSAKDFFTDAKDYLAKVSTGLEPVSKLVTSLFTFFGLLLPVFSLFS